MCCQPVCVNARSLPAWLAAARRRICCRHKLAKKADECDALSKECERRSALVAALTGDRERLAASLAAAQAKARKLAQDAAGSGPLPPRADASLLKEYVARVLQLEDEQDALQGQLRRLKQQQQQASGGCMDPPHQQQQAQQLAELQLQKDAALAAAVRLRQRLSALFGADAAADGAASSSGAGSTSGAGDAAPPAGALGPCCVDAACIAGAVCAGPCRCQRAAVYMLPRRRLRRRQQQGAAAHQLRQRQLSRRPGGCQADWARG